MHGSGDAPLAKCCCQDVTLDCLGHLLSSHLNMHTPKLMTRGKAPSRSRALALAKVYVAPIGCALYTRLVPKKKKNKLEQRNNGQAHVRSVNQILNTGILLICRLLCQVKRCT